MRRTAGPLIAIAMLLALVVPSAAAPPSAAPSEQGAAGETTFAAIGDFGTADQHEAAVARLVRSWDPAYIITTGDNYYSVAGGSGTDRYDITVGDHFGAWLRDIETTGTRCPQGLALTNAFFPALGNHDHTDAGTDTYLTYFTLPGAGFQSTSGNERYYDYVQGPIHFFVLNSDPDEPDGVTSTSKQAEWLRRGLDGSTSTWNVVYDHHPPYSSDAFHGSTAYMQWPFAAWGADAVLSGHGHDYERIMRDGIVYIVDGLGGGDRYTFSSPVEGSVVRYSADWGALKGTVTEKRLALAFYDTSGTLIDECELSAGPAAPSSLTASAVDTAHVALAWSDNATDETGFAIERSADGTDWTRIATLGPDAVGHVVTLPPAGSLTTVSKPGDGQAYASGPEWGAVRGAASGATYYTGDMEVSARLSGTTYSCSRGFLAFDLSGLPANAAVTSAYLTLSREGGASSGPGLVAVGAAAASPSSLRPADFATVGSVAFSDPVTFPSKDTPTRVELNAAGLAYLSSGAQWKSLGLRHRYDLENTTPAANERTWLWASEVNAPALRPALTVTYDSAGLSDRYRVRAYSAAGDSPWSNVATASPPPPPPPP